MKIHAALLSPFLAVLCAAAAGAAIPGAASPPGTADGAELALLLEKLRVLGSVLYVGAHPDDESTAVLAYLSQGRLARTAYLSLTRGDGGQNLIGTELGEQLGVIRTYELLAARAIDGGEQYFTRAIDFGYTKSVEETLAKWGREEVLGDVVRVIRRFQPDLIVMRFPGDGRGGHGQHTASAVLAGEAFEAAADPQRFPEQLRAPESLRPWQAARLFWDAGRFFARDGATAAGVSLPIGDYSPLLGASFTEIAARSRSQHKSQGFGSAGSRGARANPLELRAGSETAGDPFAGIDTGWSRLAGGEEIGALLDEAAEVFDPAEPAEVVPLLVRAERLLEEVDGGGSVWPEVKRRELRAAIRAALGLWIEVTTNRPRAAPGEAIELRVRAIRRAPHASAVRLRRVDLPFSPTVAPVDAVLAENVEWGRDVAARVPAGEEPTPPYWLTAPRRGDLYAVADPRLIGEAERVAYVAEFELEIEGEPVRFTVPVLYRWTDRVHGERYRSFAVTPPVAVSLDQSVAVFPDASPRALTVTVRDLRAATGAGAISGSVDLSLPDGWRADRTQAPVELQPGATVPLPFRLEPPSSPSQGVVNVSFRRNDGLEVATGFLEIDHPHIPPQILLPAARTKVVRLELARRGERIGYVMGAGDEVPEALRRVGYEVVLLSDEDLASGELDGFDAIVVGVRAYNVRDAVREHNDRLLAYVERGGTLVVQYNTVSRRGQGPDGVGPFAFRLSRDRVSVEDAPVTLLVPEHPVLREPNRITEEDFSGWVQERGLYFPNQWDERYQTPIASHDPGEPDRAGGLLYAEFGEGVYIYTGYSFFRELPAGVPGALRLFVNLVSARQ